MKLTWYLPVIILGFGLFMIVSMGLVIWGLSPKADQQTNVLYVAKVAHPGTECTDPTTTACAQVSDALAKSSTDVTILVDKGDYDGFVIPTSASHVTVQALHLNDYLPTRTIYKEGDTTLLPHIVWPGHDSPITLSSQSSDIEINGLYVNGAQGSGIVGADSIRPIIRNTVIMNSGQSGLNLASADHPIVEGNVFVGSHNAPAVWLIGKSSDNAHIVRNTFYNNDVAFQYNEPDQNKTSPAELASDDLMNANIFYNNHVAVNLFGFQKSYVQNNLMINNDQSVVSDRAQGGTVPQLNNFYNNTIVAADSAKHVVQILNGTDNHVVNNIIYQQGNLSPIEGENITAHHNLFYGRSGGLRVSDLNEVFVSPTNLDYDLKPGGKAIATGDSTVVPQLDLALTDRKGIADLGAYAFKK